MLICVVILRWQSNQYPRIYFHPGSKVLNTILNTINSIYLTSMWVGVSARGGYSHTLPIRKILNRIWQISTLKQSAKFRETVKGICFQPFINIACRSTQNAKRIKRFLRLHIVIKPLIKNRLNKFFITLKRNSFKISSQIWRLSKVRNGWPYRWFWKFFERFR